MLVLVEMRNETSHVSGHQLELRPGRVGRRTGHAGLAVQAHPPQTTKMAGKLRYQLGQRVVRANSSPYSLT